MKKKKKMQQIFVSCAHSANLHKILLAVDKFQHMKGAKNIWSSRGCWIRMHRHRNSKERKQRKQNQETVNANFYF